MSASRLATLLAACFTCWCLSIRAHAQAAPPSGLAAAWKLGPDGSAQLVVTLQGALTDKQRNMIDGGFTTLSQLTLKLPISRTDEAREAELPVFHGLSCSVKFDAWEETYDVTRLAENPETALLKDFDSYAAFCLRMGLGGPALTARMGPEGGVLLAQLVVQQTSPEEASQIKDWLIQQQSGVMQGLFSHMLGELSLNQTIKARIVVPPKPEVLERADAQATPAVVQAMPTPAKVSPVVRETVATSKKPAKAAEDSVKSTKKNTPERASGKTKRPTVKTDGAAATATTAPTNEPPAAAGPNGGSAVRRTKQQVVLPTSPELTPPPAAPPPPVTPLAVPAQESPP